MGAILTGTRAQVTPTPSPSSPALGGVSTVKEVFGSGIEIYSNIQDGGLIYRGINTFAPAATTLSLTAQNIIGAQTMVINPLRNNLTVYLPASTTFPSSFLPRSGDRTSISVFNSTTTTGTVLGFTGGSGTLVTVASTTIVGTASTTNQNIMRIGIMRKPNTDLLFYFEPFK